MSFLEANGPFYALNVSTNNLIAIPFSVRVKRETEKSSIERKEN